MRRDIILWIFFFTVPFIIPSTQARTLYDYELIAGQTLSLKEYNTKRVSIVNPNVVDVIKATKDEILLSAKGPGQTAVLIEDKNGALTTYQIKVFSKDLNILYKSFEKTLRDAGLLNKVVLKENKEIERIIVEGELSPSDKAKLEAVAASYEGDVLNLTKEKESQDLIYIEVEVLEVSKDALDKIGIEWAQQIKLSEGAIPSTRT